MERQPNQTKKTHIMTDTIRQSDLRPGDVLLYHGSGLLSRLIRLFDGTNYSHAGIWTGKRVVEALGNGVNGRMLHVSVKGAQYVHVFRYRDKAGKELGAALSPDPVTGQADQFVQNGNRYGYEQLLLLALLASTRRLTSPVPFLGRILRNFLDSAADVLARLGALGKEPLICSELVYRCYEQAGADYKVLIRGADMAAGMAMATMDAPPKADADDGGYLESALVFLEKYQALKPAPPADPALGGAVMAVSNFVTPGDLSKSPNLRLLGRLAG